MIYRIYYLTSDKDFNVPMYVGATRKTLKQRLHNHKSECSLKKKGNKALNWKKSRYKNLKIHLLQDNIELKDVEKLEVFWIEFWRKINPDLRNTTKYIRYCIKPEHLLIDKRTLSERIKESVIHRNKPIIVLNKDGTLYKEYPSVGLCAKELKTTITTISQAAKDKKRNQKFNFVYKADYDPNKDYSYKNINKRKIPAKISKECLSAAYAKTRKRCFIEDENGENIKYFDSLTNCAKFLGVVNSTIEKKIRLGKPCKGFKVKIL